jgi:hypothetical protein
VIQESVRLYGVPVRDGVKGSSHGAIYRLWQSGAKYDMVAKSMNYTRWIAALSTKIDKFSLPDDNEDEDES